MKSGVSLVVDCVDFADFFRFAPVVVKDDIDQLTRSTVFARAREVQRVLHHLIRRREFPTLVQQSVDELLVAALCGVEHGVVPE